MKMQNILMVFPMLLSSLLAADQTFTVNLKGDDLPSEIAAIKGGTAVVKNDGSRRVMVATFAKESLVCPVTFKPDILWDDDMAISFMAKISVFDGKASYLGISAKTSDGNEYFFSYGCPVDWEHVVVPVSSMQHVVIKPVAPGRKVEKITIYIRASGDKNTDAIKADLALSDIELIPKKMIKRRFLHEAETQFLYTPGNSPELPSFLIASNANYQIEGEGVNRHISASVSNSSTFCSMKLKINVASSKDLKISFTHKEKIDTGKAKYLGITFVDSENKHWFKAASISQSKADVKFNLNDFETYDKAEIGGDRRLIEMEIYIRGLGETLQEGFTGKFEIFNLSLVPAACDLISYSNPPLMTWPQISDAKSYELQYCSSPDFKSNVIIAKCQWNFYTPNEPVKADTVYWRTRPEGASKWTRSGRIEIASGGCIFTTHPASLSQLVKQNHPRVIPQKSFISDLEGRYKSQVVDFKVPSDPPKYREGNPAWPTWVDWLREVTEKQVMSTGFRLRILAEYYILNPTPEKAQTLKEWALKVASWDCNNGSSAYSNDIAAQAILRGLCYSYDALYSQLSKEERQQLVRAIAARAEQAYVGYNPWPEGLNKEYNNHSWIAANGFGEAGAVLLGEHPDAEKWSEYARQLFLGKFLCINGREGANFEGIPYWAYGLQFIMCYSDMVKDAFAINLYEHPWLKLTAKFPLYCAPPNAWEMSFANSGSPNHGRIGPDYQSTVALIAERTSDPYALWYAGKADSINEIYPKPPADLPASAFYPTIGWAIFNSNIIDGRLGVSCGFRSGRFVTGHQHEDQNNFLINAYGAKLAILSGYYDYFGSPHFNEYSTKTKAHNTLLIDGLDQDSRKAGADGHIDNFFASTSFGFTKGDGSNRQLYQGHLKSWKRSILFLMPEIVIVKDDIEAEQTVSVDWLFHAASPITIAANSFSLTNNKVVLHGTFLEPERIVLTITDSFPVAPVDGHSSRVLDVKEIVPEWHLKATPLDSSKINTIISVLQISKEAEYRKHIIKKISAENSFGFRVETSNGSNLIFFRTKPGTIKYGKWETDGTVCAIKMDCNERPGAFCVIGGSFLKMNGANLLSASGQACDFAKISDISGELYEINSNTPLQIEIASDNNALRTTVNGCLSHADTLDLQKGFNRIVRTTDSGTFDSRVIPDIKADGIILKGYAARECDGMHYYYWGNIMRKEAGDVRFSLIPELSDASFSLIIGKSLVSGENGSSVISIKSSLIHGNNFIILTGTSLLKGLKIE